MDMEKAPFDPSTDNSWYYPRISMREGIMLLLVERVTGTYLLLDAISNPGDYLLLVKDGMQICPYIIDNIKKKDGGDSKFRQYRIHDKVFDDLPTLIKYYMEESVGGRVRLARPPQVRKLEKVVALYDCTADRRKELSFKKGDVLVIIGKPHDDWWMARSGLGEVGLIPKNYVELVEEEAPKGGTGGSGSASESSKEDKKGVTGTAQAKRKNWIEPKETTYVLCVKRKEPGVYAEKTMLTLEVGDILHLTRMHVGGVWEGEFLSGEGMEKNAEKKGYFPHNCVDILHELPDILKNQTQTEEEAKPPNQEK